MNYFLKQFDQVELLEDQNPVIVKGMVGVILEIYNQGEAYEVEFVKEDASNYEFEGQITFAVPNTQLKLYNEK